MVTDGLNETAHGTPDQFSPRRTPPFYSNIGKIDNPTVVHHKAPENQGNLSNRSGNNKIAIEVNYWNGD